MSVALLPLALSLAGSMLLSACATQAPAAAVRTADRGERLQALGFVKTEDGYVLNLSEALLFQSGSDALGATAKTALAKLANDLRALEISKLRLFGHTDNTGAVEYNRDLSTRRAEAVAREIAAFGFSSDNLERRGFAAERPIASNTTPEGRAQNRRVAVIVPFE